MKDSLLEWWIKKFPGASNVLCVIMSANDARGMINSSSIAPNATVRPRRNRHFFAINT